MFQYLLIDIIHLCSPAQQPEPVVVLGPRGAAARAAQCTPLQRTAPAAGQTLARKGTEDLKLKPCTIAQQ